MIYEHINLYIDKELDTNVVQILGGVHSKTEK